MNPRKYWKLRERIGRFIVAAFVLAVIYKLAAFIAGLF